jgi:hypothetical protein
MVCLRKYHEMGLFDYRPSIFSKKRIVSYSRMAYLFSDHDIFVVGYDTKYRDLYVVSLKVFKLDDSLKVLKLGGL